MDLRSEEYDLLEKHFELKDDKTRVDYLSLIEQVNTVFTVKGLEKNPFQRPEEFKMPDYLDPEKRLNEAEAEFLHDTMCKLGYLCMKYRVLTKTFFADAVKK